MKDLNELKAELDGLKSELFDQGYETKEELIQFESLNQEKFSRYYSLVKEIESLEWELMTASERAEREEQEKMSKLKREGKLYDYLVNKKKEQ